MHRARNTHIALQLLEAARTIKKAVRAAFYITNHSRLATGHGPVLEQPLAKLDQAIAKATRIVGSSQQADSATASKS